MADNPVTEMLPVLPIEELPYATKVTSDAKFPMSQNGRAMKVLGDQIADFAREAAAQDVQRAIDAANAAEKSVSDAAQEVERAKGEADRAADLRQSIEVDYEALRQAVEGAEGHADRAEAEADRAGDEADRSGDNAALSESWAVGGTGTRQGEDKNNARYWADRAQAEAERAAVPPVEGVYNTVLEDRATGERYVLLVEDGRLVLLSVADTLQATDLLIVDCVTGIAHAVIVENGRLVVEETA